MFSFILLVSVLVAEVGNEREELLVGEFIKEMGTVSLVLSLSLLNSKLHCNGGYICCSCVRKMNCFLNDYVLHSGYLDSGFRGMIVWEFGCSWVCSQTVIYPCEYILLELYLSPWGFWGGYTYEDKWECITNLLIYWIMLYNIWVVLKSRPVWTFSTNTLLLGQCLKNIN